MAEKFKTYYVSLDMYKTSSDTFEVVEGDTANLIVITLTDRGNPVDLTDCKVLVVFVRGGVPAQQDTDGNGVTISGENHNIITVDLYSTSYVNGNNTAEVVVLSGEGFARQSTSAWFNFQARRARINDNTLLAVAQFPLLSSMLTTLTNIARGVQAQWSMADANDPSYIQDKPVIGTDLQAATQQLTAAEAAIADTATLPVYDTVHKSITWAQVKSWLATAFASVFAPLAHASRHAYGAPDALDTDASPTSGSNKPVRSGGVYTAIANATTNSGISSNLLINPSFNINQRGVSGSVVLASGVYGHDRWKGGASGGNYTFATSENITTLTIAAGKSIIQVVEGKNLQSGTVCLTWTGTAQGKIGAGSFGASGITGAAVGGANLNIEFGEGTLSNVQLNYGEVALPFVPRSYADELRLCQRYYFLTGAVAAYRIASYSADVFQAAVPIPVTMRADPTPIGAANTVFVIRTTAGAAQTGFTVSVFACANNAVYVRMSKTGHGLTDAHLLVESTAAFDAEL